VFYRTKRLGLTTTLIGGMARLGNFPCSVASAVPVRLWWTEPLPWILAGSYCEMVRVTIEGYFSVISHSQNYAEGSRIRAKITAFQNLR
jgi:hypothetical protein